MKFSQRYISQRLPSFFELKYLDVVTFAQPGDDFDGIGRVSQKIPSCTNLFRTDELETFLFNYTVLCTTGTVCICNIMLHLLY